jgi:hypothetical protein
MVDYITEVCYGSKHIKKIKFSDNSVLTKQQVVNKINNGHIIYTKTRNGLTSKVNTFKRNGVDYIRSDRDATTEDNLEKLPTFSC